MEWIKDMFSRLTFDPTSLTPIKRDPDCFFTAMEMAFLEKGRMASEQMDKICAAKAKELFLAC